MQKRSFPAAPQWIFLSLWRHRDLVWQMMKRDVIGRYRGSIMGVLWSFFNPILMLGVYTFVFSVVFQARWGEGMAGKADFAILLFTGLIVHALFAECVNRSPTLVLNNVNYVKKVVFPLEVLPWVAMGSALFHTAVSVLVLLAFVGIIQAPLDWTALFLPIVLMPMIFLTMGLSWFLASLGVYVRDIGQITGIITTALLFLGPIFYPVSALPEAYRPLIYINPLTFIVEQARTVLIWGQTPDWVGLAAYSVIGLLVAWLGFIWFQLTRRGFADVI